ncbi:MAG: hypothetical protein NTV88_00220 [Candidatus Micrarchaeota archaeon]|nr:hypothetical protein [Candidatus Micrarchaeota archaeon]
MASAYKLNGKTFSEGAKEAKMPDYAQLVQSYKNSSEREPIMLN